MKKIKEVVLMPSGLILFPPVSPLDLLPFASVVAECLQETDK